MPMRDPRENKNKLVKLNDSIFDKAIYYTVKETSPALKKKKAADLIMSAAFLIEFKL